MTDGSDLHDNELGEVDEAELEQAERLARALDERAESAAPEDALEAALLLRVLNDGELSDERARALAPEVLRSVRVQSRRSRLVWSLLSAALGLGALLVVLRLDRRDQPVARLPEPSVDLLTSQASLLSGEKTAEYPRQMAAYRQQVWTALHSASGANQ